MFLCIFIWNIRKIIKGTVSRWPFFLMRSHLRHALYLRDDYHTLGTMSSILMHIQAGFQERTIIYCIGSSFLVDLQLTGEALRSGSISFPKPLVALQEWTSEEGRKSQSWQTGKQEGFEMQNGYYFSQNPSKGSSADTPWTSLCLSSCKCVVFKYGFFWEVRS